jgi:hypothetical protein
LPEIQAMNYFYEIISMRIKATISFVSISAVKTIEGLCRGWPDRSAYGWNAIRVCVLRIEFLLAGVALGFNAFGVLAHTPLQLCCIVYLDEITAE